MLKRIKHQVDQWFKKVPKSEERESVKQDIVESLQEKAYDLMEKGVDKEQAIEQAIREFGDVKEIIAELDGKNQQIKKDMAKINLGFSIWGSILIISLFLFINFYYTPNVIWFVYPTFVVLWWPLSMFYYWLRVKRGGS